MAASQHSDSHLDVWSANTAVRAFFQSQGFAPCNERAAALEEALAHYGCPEIVNTNQGSQFTSVEFLNVLRRREIQISMDGKGCWRDNVFVERLLRPVKYGQVYLRGYETVSDVRAGLTRYFQFFNQRRPHRGLRSRIPDTVYFTALPERPTPSPRAIPLIPAA